MKTIQQLKQEISEIRDRIESEVLKKGEEPKLRARIKFLNQCIRYIETEPKEDFMSAEIKRLQFKIEKRVEAFPAERFKNLALKDFSKMRRDFEKMYDVPKLRLQLRTIKFLLAA